MRRFNVVAIVILLGAVGALMALSPRNTKKIQSAVLGAIAPLLKSGSGMQNRIVAFREGLKSLDELETENEVLKVQNKELKAVNQTLRGLEQENIELRSALEYRERSVFKLIPARVIGRDSSSWWNTIQVDRGSADGIKIDMPVLTDDGLIGKTTVVSEHASTVILLADENCKVASRVEGTREQGIVKGDRLSTTAQPEISLSFLSKTANLEPGQKVYTSGVGGVYPDGVFVGVIKKFEVRALDGYATLVPAVDFNSLEDVFIVTGRK